MLGNYFGNVNRQASALLFLVLLLRNNVDSNGRDGGTFFNVQGRSGRRPCHLFSNKEPSGTACSSVFHGSGRRNFFGTRCRNAQMECQSSTNLKYRDQYQYIVSIQGGSTLNDSATVATNRKNGDYAAIGVLVANGNFSNNSKAPETTGKTVEPILEGILFRADPFVLLPIGSGNGEDRMKVEKHFRRKNKKTMITQRTRWWDEHRGRDNRATFSNNQFVVQGVATVCDATAVIIEDIALDAEDASLTDLKQVAQALKQAYQQRHEQGLKSQLILILPAELSDQQFSKWKVKLLSDEFQFIISGNIVDHFDIVMHDETLLELWTNAMIEDVGSTENEKKRTSAYVEAKSFHMLLSNLVHSLCKEKSENCEEHVHYHYDDDETLTHLTTTQSDDAPVDDEGEPSSFVDLDEIEADFNARSATLMGDNMDRNSSHHKNGDDLLSTEINESAKKIIVESTTIVENDPGKGNDNRKYGSCDAAVTRGAKLEDYSTNAAVIDTTSDACTNTLMNGSEKVPASGYDKASTLAKSNNENKKVLTSVISAPDDFHTDESLIAKTTSMPTGEPLNNSDTHPADENDIDVAFSSNDDNDYDVSVLSLDPVDSKSDKQDLSTINNAEVKLSSESLNLPLEDKMSSTEGEIEKSIMNQIDGDSSRENNNNGNKENWNMQSISIDSTTELNHNECDKSLVETIVKKSVKSIFFQNEDEPTIAAVHADDASILDTIDISGGSIHNRDNNEVKSSSFDTIDSARPMTNELPPDAIGGSANNDDVSYVRPSSSAAIDTANTSINEAPQVVASVSINKSNNNEVEPLPISTDDDASPSIVESSQDTASDNMVQQDDILSSFDAPDTVCESTDESFLSAADGSINDHDNESLFGACDDESLHEVDNEWSASLDANYHEEDVNYHEEDANYREEDANYHEEEDVCADISFTKKEDDLSFSHQKEYDMGNFVEEEVDDGRELSLSGDIAPTITSDFDDTYNSNDNEEEEQEEAYLSALLEAVDVTEIVANDGNHKDTLFVASKPAAPEAVYSKMENSKKIQEGVVLENYPNESLTETILALAREQLDELEAKQQEAWLTMSSSFPGEEDESLGRGLSASSTPPPLLIEFSEEANRILEEVSMQLENHPSRQDLLMDITTKQLKPLFLEHLQSLREYYGKRFENMLEENSESPLSWKDCAQYITDGFRAAALHSIPKLCSPESELRDPDFEYVFTLLGLISDMTHVTEQLHQEQALQLSLDNDDESTNYEDLITGSKDALDYFQEITTSPSTVVKRKRSFGLFKRKRVKIPKWMRKLGARASVLAVNYIQGWLAYQGVKRAALQRDKNMPKFLLF